MSFDWRNYLEFSKKVVESPPEEIKEAFYRSAVSRAYYSVFKLAQDCLIDKKVPLPINESSGKVLRSHERVIYYLANYPDNEIRDIAADLNILRLSRVNADYKKSISHNARAAELQIKIAEEVLTKIEQRMLC